MRTSTKASLMVLGVVLLVAAVPAIGLGTWWVVKIAKVNKFLKQAKKENPELEVATSGSNIGAVMFLVAAIVAFLLGILFIYLAQ